MKYSVILLVLFFATSFGAKFPSDWTKCNRKQHDCILKSAQFAIESMTKARPEIGLPRMEPLEYEYFEINGGNADSAFSVEQKFSKCLFTGFSRLKLADVKLDPESKVFHVGGMFPKVQMTAHYDIKGRLLLLPFDGSGPCTVTMYNVTASFTGDLEEYTKKAQKYVKVTSGRADLDPGLVTFNFENLFNGDKTLGDNMNKVLNENWKSVYGDIKEAHKKTVGATIIDTANSFFSKVPINEIFLD